MKVRWRIKQSFGRRGSFRAPEEGGWTSVWGARSVLILSNSDPKRFPSHGSVAFHTYSSSIIQIIGLMMNSAERDREAGGRRGEI